MIPVRGYDGQKVAVLGLGRSGRATCHALRAGGAEVLAWDDGDAARAAAAAEGVTLCPLTRDADWQDVVALITSPGIPHLYPQPHPLIAAAQAYGVVVDNDIGLFFRSWGTEDWDRFDRMPQVVAITGSNGKSTTTALITHILRDIGRPVQMGGNIGRGVLDLDPAEDGSVAVLELSSYQIELARALAPDLAVFLNLSDDHLERHGGRGGYFAAKARLFTSGGPERSIIGVDEAEGRFLAGQLREDATHGEPVIRISTREKLKDGWSVSVAKGYLSEWRRGRQVAAIDLRQMPSLPGAHNHQNAAAAYAVVRALGYGAKEIEAAMASYPGLAHRCQILGQIDGITVVNDSKATNADAAEKALLSFDRIHWIAGGVPKAGGIDGLMPLMERVKHAYLIGEASEGFAMTLADHPHSLAGTLDLAFAEALAAAEPGDVILLAPACASFDQFESFEARGLALAALFEAATG